MERRNQRLGQRDVAQQPVHALAHLRGCLVGKGHGQNRVRRNILLLDQPGNAAGDYARLARSGPGQDQQGALGSLYGRALFGIQVGKELQMKVQAGKLLFQCIVGIRCAVLAPRYPESIMTTSNLSLRRVAVYCGSADGTIPHFAPKPRPWARRSPLPGWAWSTAGQMQAHGRGGRCGSRRWRRGHRRAARGARRPGDAHAGLTALELVPTMHERKARMAELADAFLALPGGYGTLDELLEAVTWAQLGLHAKPCILINYRGLLGWTAALPRFTVTAGFLSLKTGTAARSRKHGRCASDGASPF